MLKIIEGDLLEIPNGTIIHQCNCIGATGGLAGALRRKWPEAFERYIETCDEAARPYDLLGKFTLGWSNDDKIEVIHLFGQLYPGPNTDMVAVESALKSFASTSPLCPIYAPWKCGCGLGGGDWVEYSAAIERHLPQCIIVRKYQ